MFIIFLLLLIPTTHADCTTLIIETEVQYANLTKQLQACGSVNSLTLDSLTLDQINISLSVSVVSVTIKNCPKLTKVVVRQVAYLASGYGAQFNFENDTLLIDYDIQVLNKTVLSFKQVPQPINLNIQPTSLITGLTVQSTRWYDFSIISRYSLLEFLSLSDLSTLQDLSFIFDNTVTGGLFLKNLPQLNSLSHLSSLRNLLTLLLDDLPLVTSLLGLGGMQTTYNLIVKNLPSLTDISAISHIQAASIVWDNCPNICCPDISTGFYDSIPESKRPTCQDCFTVTEISPKDGPTQGGTTVYLTYQGGIRSSTIRIYWQDRYSVCSVVELGKIKCMLPGGNGVIKLDYSLDNAKHSTGVEFTYLSISDLLTTRSSISYQDSCTDLPCISSTDVRPKDNSMKVAYAQEIVWGIVGSGMFLATIVFLIFSLPNALDLIRSPTIMNIGKGTSVVAGKRTAMGALFTLFAMMLVMGVTLHSIIPYAIDNTWGSTNHISAIPSVLPLFDLKVKMTTFPNICGSITLSAPFQGQMSSDPIKGTCEVTWAQSSYLTASSLTFGLLSSSWQDYLYWISYSVDLKGSGQLSSSTRFFRSANSSHLIKGDSGVLDITATKSLLRHEGNTDYGITIHSSKLTNMKDTHVDNFLSEIGVSASINVKFTDNWEETYILTKQSFFGLLSQIVALCSCVAAGIRLTMYFIARRFHKQSNKPDIELRLRKQSAKSVDQPPDAELGASVQQDDLKGKELEDNVV